MIHSLDKRERYEGVRVYGNLTSYKAQSENQEAIEWS